MAETDEEDLRRNTELIVWSSDVGWGRGVVAVIATGPRFTFAHQQMPHAFLNVGRLTTTSLLSLLLDFTIF